MASKSTYSYFRISKTEGVALSAQRYRTLRLNALKASPASFSSTYEIEAAFTEADWVNLLTTPGREVFICAATPQDAAQSSSNETEWVGQVTIRGPLSSADFTLPPESGQPATKSDAKEERWQMLSLFTLSEHRGQGLGKNLCLEALRYLQFYRPQPPVVQVRLMVKPGNHAAVKLYQGLQFALVGKCTLKEAFLANGDAHLLPATTSGPRFSERSGFIMMYCISRV
jgi:ribosomal protein S18 acetylase RimI-like enzyme